MTFSLESKCTRIIVHDIVVHWCRYLLTDLIFSLFTYCTGVYSSFVYTESFYPVAVILDIITTDIILLQNEIHGMLKDKKRLRFRVIHLIEFIQSNNFHIILNFLTSAVYSECDFKV